MDHTVPLWAATAAAGALFAVSLAGAVRLQTSASGLWSAALGTLLLRVTLGHIDPTGPLAAPALSIALAASPAFAILFCLGALNISGARIDRNALFTASLAAAGWLGILSYAGRNPGLAVAPAELLAAGLCLYTLMKTRPGATMGMALSLLLVRALSRPFTFGLEIQPLWVLAFSALTWGLPAVAMAGALLDEAMARNKVHLSEAVARVGESAARRGRDLLLKQLTNTPDIRLLIEPRSGRITEGSPSGFELLTSGGVGPRNRTLWEFAPAGGATALRDAVLSLPTAGEPATLLLEVGGKATGFKASANEIELDGRLYLSLTLAREGADTATRLETSGALAAGLAHDLKNVLQTILSCSDGIARGSGSDGTAARAIAESARKGDRLVKRILGGANASPEEERATELTGMLRGLADTWRPSLPASIELRMELDDQPIRLQGSGEELEQAVLNLLVNARESSREVRTILLGLRREGDAALIYVEDDGPGVPEGLREKIFEPLVTTKGRPGGLGLSMVAATLKKQGGSASCSAGVTLPGARFTLSIPLPAPKRGGAVLIVDADDGARGELSRELKLKGYTVYTTDDGNRAMAILKERGPLIGTVIADLVTKGLGGRNLLNALREQAPQARVLVHSSICSKAAREGSLATGAAGFYPKEKDGGALLAAIQEG